MVIHNQHFIQESAGQADFVKHFSGLHMFAKAVLGPKIAAIFEKHSQGPIDKLKEFYVQAIDSSKIVEQAIVSQSAGSNAIPTGVR